MRICEALKIAGELCESPYIARELMKFHIGFSDEKLILNLNENVMEYEEFFRLVNLYKNGTPLEYITTVAHFFGLEFFVDERVLIPRFETEILVDKAINIVKTFTNPRICEIGTGSGIISVILKKEFANAVVIATDISQDALEVAKINAAKYDVDIDFVNCSLMDKICGEFDIIISNPPYISNTYTLDKWVLKEPKIALFGGEVGDEILYKIINLAKTRAKFLCCEMGYDQKINLSQFLTKNGFKAEFYQDLAGFDRGFVARRSVNA